MGMNMKQGSIEWIAMRKNHIGASDAPIIMGVSPYTTPYELWLDKLGLAKDKIVTASMQRGNQLEPKAREIFQAHTGIEMIPKVIVHPDISYMMASLDGISSEGFAVEIKCPGAIDHASALNGEVPEKYIPQLQHQMEVCGLEWIFYFSFDGENGKILEVKRDQNYIDKMLIKEKEFWDCVLNFEPPEFTSKDYVTRNDNEWRLYAEQYRISDQTIKASQQIKDRAKDNLIRLSGKSSCQGAGLKLCHIVRKGNIPYKDIPEIQKMDLEKYRKPATETWRII